MSDHAIVPITRGPMKGMVNVVAKNPSRKEIHESSYKTAGHGEIGVYLHHNDMYSFDRMGHLHGEIKPHLGVKDQEHLLPLYVYHNKDSVHFHITDASRHSVFHHKPNLEEHIENHPHVQKLWGKHEKTYSYHDDAIVGDWKNLKENTRMSFRNYLREAWKFEKMDGKKTRDSATHTSTIDGHTVHIGMDDLSGKGNYDTEFTVDGNYTRGSFGSKRVNPETGKKIFTHVQKNVDRFVRHMKVKKLTYTSLKPTLGDLAPQHEKDHADAKQKLYAKAAQRMARRYGGTASSKENKREGYAVHTVKIR